MEAILYGDQIGRQSHYVSTSKQYLAARSLA